MSAEAAEAVTVVIPTADRPVLLERAVKSVAEQDYDGDIECLIVFDGPLGRVPALAPRDGRTIRAVQNTRSPGLAGARNTGILAAQSPLIAFLDDDDEWLPAKVRRQVELLAREPEAVAVGCANVVVYDGHETVRPAPARVTFPALLRSRVAVLHSSTILARRENIVDRVGLVDEGIPSGASEDYEWQLRATRHGPIAMVTAPLVRVDWHSDSRLSRQWEQFVAGLKYVLAKNPEFRHERRGASRIYGQIAFGYAAMGRTRDAIRWAVRCMTSDWRQPRAYLSLLVASRAVSSDAVVRRLHLRGKGV